ncbi:Dyp-type peroxidase [Hydrogenovibrio marinus]|uniref:Dyp-type peroxidase n=1 Tax=Hydrogenovibrio marinus TaxID=28885 RepID=UPI0006896C9D|nr:Dyp-type peroxidase [Hydrogenovibrio marinus]BBN60573.1 deferrochelatase/peroxidase YfeX [Hydrogenovibrio marinus]
MTAEIFQPYQEGIFQEGARHTYFLEYKLDFSKIDAVRQAIAKCLQSHPIDEVVIARYPKEALKVRTVVSFGKRAWKALASDSKMPKDLKDFETLSGQQGHTSPSTQRDVFLWLQADDFSVLYDQATWIQKQMKSVAELAFEQVGFNYYHSLDLIGFEDGTANPKTDELRVSAAVIPEGQPGAGGSLVLSQKWVHDMDTWSQVPLHCQEAIVGRTKRANEELEGEMMPDDSHVSRTDLKVDGVAMKIFRRSSAFGNLSEKGLMFLAFGCELRRFSTQLDSMFGLTEDGKIDQIIRYSKAVTGSYWFAPSKEDLAEVFETETF